MSSERGFLWFHRRDILKSMHSSVKAPAVSVADVAFIAEEGAQCWGAKGNRIMKYHPCISPPQACCNKAVPHMSPFDLVLFSFLNECNSRQL